MSNQARFRYETLQLHVGQEIDPATGSVSIYQTTSCCFKDAAHLVALKELSNFYTRSINPTSMCLKSA